MFCWIRSWVHICFPSWLIISRLPADVEQDVSSSWKLLAVEFPTDSDILSSRRICTASAGFPHWPWALSDSSHPRAFMSCSLCNLLCLVRCSCWLGLWSSKCRAFYHYAFSNFKRIVFVLMNFSFGHKGERRKGLSILCTSVVFFAGKWLPCDVRIKHKA